MPALLALLIATGFGKTESAKPAPVRPQDLCALVLQLAHTRPPSGKPSVMESGRGRCVGLVGGKALIEATRSSSEGDLAPLFDDAFSCSDAEFEVLRSDHKVCPHPEHVFWLDLEPKSTGKYQYTVGVVSFPTPDDPTANLWGCGGMGGTASWTDNAWKLAPL